MSAIEAQPIAGSWASLPVKLSEPILTKLAELEFTQMTPVQAATIPLFMMNKDVVVEAVTGSGKTLSFLIPLIEILLRKEQPLAKNEVGGIVIEPTRELAKQVAGVLEQFMQAIPSLNYQLFVGGNKLPEDLKKFREKGSSIAIVTPGRLLDLLNKAHDFYVKDLEMLVLDEADRLLDLGFEQTLNAILLKLPKQRRTGLFSATMTDALNDLVRAGLRNAVRIVVKVENTKSQAERRTPTTLENYYLVCPLEQKIAQLVCLLKGKELDKILIYFATCACVDYFYKALQVIPELKKFPFLSMHGKVPQEKRNAVFEKYYEMPNGVLLCSDVAARGLDIPDVDWVIQFDPPQDPSAFIHRCGRTARIGKVGKALSFLQESEDTYVEFLKIRKVPLQQTKPFDISGCPDYLAIIKAALMSDKALYEKSVKAFVSYVRHYKEHQLKYIFRFKDLDLGSLARLYSLLKLPKMPELKNVKLDFEESEVKPEDLKYANKVREQHRLKIAKEKTSQQPASESPTNPSAPKQSVAWSKVKDKKKDKKKRREIKQAKKEFEKAHPEAVKRKAEDSGPGSSSQPAKKLKVQQE